MDNNIFHAVVCQNVDGVPMLKFEDFQSFAYKQFMIIKRLEQENEKLKSDNAKLVEGLEELIFTCDDRSAVSDIKNILRNRRGQE